MLKRSPYQQRQWHLLRTVPPIDLGRSKLEIEAGRFDSYAETEAGTLLNPMLRSLIEAFGESNDDCLEGDVDVITDSTLNKRMKDMEHYHGSGDESSKKMEDIKIEKD
ncbi:hypothetical protein DM860_003833 [Cuscuta australis]|uniref:Uncharacterized protein n=1 Tax=Cuscuta australis TaxID=267555 RepID=A0A328CXC5_9ASTE|nr:hypothetical protein DM860_003833 [Cuscuta australis]